VTEKVAKLLESVDKEPRTTGWTLRARIGEKRKRHGDVEELPGIQLVKWSRFAPCLL